MIGYAKLLQVTKGIHTRLFSRAFIMEQNGTRIVYVSTDLGMVTLAVKTFVVEKLQKIYGPSLYKHDNIMISCTHTHSGPAGFSWYTLYGTNSFGFNHQNFDAIVNGIVKSIQIAHNNLKKGKIYFNSGNIFSSSYNRSPTAYEANPLLERKEYGLNFDSNFTQFKFQYDSGEYIGILNWFPVHGTSMKNNNTLISSDNKGYASILFEKKMNGGLIGQGPFVAGFAQSNEGDVSPNTKGAFCENGEPCEPIHSTCNGYSQGCNSVGPGKDQFESTRIIGEIQYTNAMEAFTRPNRLLKGDIRYIHAWINMENTTVTPEFTGLSHNVTTCIGALGDSFAAGCVDGPGEFNFVQGTNDSNTNAGWHWLAEQLFGKIPEEQKICHYPKPILFLTGNMFYPSKWSQGVVPVQLFKIGDIWIAAVPSEFTTMAGRRLKNRIKKTLIEANAWTPTSQVILSGLSNSYTHYVTTKEEYSHQRYEGASTLFGPHTLNAYEMVFTQLANTLVKGTPPPVSSKPEDFRDKIISLMPEVIPDSAPNNSFGAVITDAKPQYRTGEMVTVEFWTGNPRNDLRIGDTFLTVERYSSGWKVVATDADWETKYYWNRVGIAQSTAKIEWNIPHSTTPGTYRIRHFGNWKDEKGVIHPLVGESRNFTVVASYTVDLFKNNYGF